MALFRARLQITICHIAFLLLPTIYADRLFTPSTGTMFGSNSHEPKYKIEFHSALSPFHPHEGQESMTMSNKDGKKFSCFLPVVEEAKPKSVSHTNNSGTLVSTDRHAKMKTVDELLDVLKDKCMARLEGWWTYEFCYHKKIRQVHLEDGKATQEFVLGEYDSVATGMHNQNHSDDSTLKDPRFKDVAQRYHSHMYTNGTVCDLTGQPRETEVRFVCSDSMTLLASIKEVSTCKYVATVQGTMLCKHPLFQQEKPAWYTIHCNELREEGSDPGESHDSIEKRISIVVDDTGRYAAT